MSWNVDQTLMAKAKVFYIVHTFNKAHSLKCDNGRYPKSTFKKVKVRVKPHLERHSNQSVFARLNLNAFKIYKHNKM